MIEEPVTNSRWVLRLATLAFSGPLAQGGTIKPFLNESLVLTLEGTVGKLISRRVKVDTAAAAAAALNAFEMLINYLGSQEKAPSLGRLHPPQASHRIVGSG